MTVVVNGQPRELSGSAPSVEEAVRAAGAPPAGRGVAVAVDGEVVPRSDWDTTLLSEGQRVEVLQAVQGG
jgi:sulfur carrier protein